MDFDVSRPIWVQLAEEFARRIAVGRWQPGERLPAVRDLAADLGVNPNTVQRALSELERDGLCRAERTAGRFVTEDPERIAELREEILGQSADNFIAAAQGLGLSQAQTVKLISRRWPENSITGSQQDPAASPFSQQMPGGGL